MIWNSLLSKRSYWKAVHTHVVVTNAWEIHNLRNIQFGEDVRCANSRALENSRRAKGTGAKDNKLCRKRYFHRCFVLFVIQVLDPNGAILSNMMLGNNSITDSQTYSKTTRKTRL